MALISDKEPLGGGLWRGGAESGDAEGDGSAGLSRRKCIVDATELSGRWYTLHLRCGTREVANIVITTPNFSR